MRPRAARSRGEGTALHPGGRRGVLLLRTESQTLTPFKMKTSKLKKGIPRVVFAFCISAFCIAPGCARFSTPQTDLSYENGQPQRALTTKAAAFTFFSARSQLTNWKASQTDKTQGATVGALTQESSATNLVDLVGAIVSGAVQGAVKAAKP